MDYEALDLKANLGAFSTFDAEILVPEVQKLGPDDIYLEVGVDRGKSLSIARMVADKDAEIWGVDISAPDPLVPKTNYIQADSKVAAELWQNKKISVLFIDGDHSYEGCKADIDAWYPHMKENGVMLFHDCDETSPGVMKAVAEFAENNKLDVFYHPNQRCSMARIYL